DVTSFWGGDDPGEVTLSDPASLFKAALGKSSTYSGEGAKGYAARIGDGEYLVLECEQETRDYHGELDAALDGTKGATVGVTITSVIGRAGYTQRTSAESVTATNKFGFIADSGAEVRIEWNDDFSRWEVLQVECPAE